MGDERPAATEPAASAATVTQPVTGTDQIAVRAAPDTRPSATIGGEDVGRSEASEGREPGNADSAGLGVGPATDPAAEYADETGRGRDADIRSAQAVAQASTGLMTLDDIENHVLRAIRYHEARARFLDFWRRTFDFLVVLGGAGAVTTVAGDCNGRATAALGVALAAIGAIQLVAGFAEKAGEHTALKRRFCAVLAKIVEARNEDVVDPRAFAKILKSWSAIWTDEPPTMHVLEAIAWNGARRAREFNLDEDTLIEISWFQSLTRNLSSWESFEPLTRAERRERREGHSVGSAEASAATSGAS